MDPLITCDELADRLDEVKIFDIRWALTDPNHGRNTYLSGHVPGAIFVDLDRDLSAPPGQEGRHPLPDPDVWAKTLGRLGIEPGAEVIVYDDMGGAVAARMWWMLRSSGHEESRLLNGGFEKWRDHGHPLAEGAVVAAPTVYPTPEGFHGVVFHEALGDRNLIDVRAPERYRGDTEPVDPKAGHIPGAVNIPLADNLDDDATFRQSTELADLYADITQPVVSCGSGVNACHTALALVVAGREMPDVYVGSFSEWSRLDLPVTTGDSP
jgi:thiosulfate/3-mercaptopyruvate sulfurtransferase